MTFTGNDKRIFTVDNHFYSVADKSDCRDNHNSADQTHKYGSELVVRIVRIDTGTDNDNGNCYRN